MQQKRAGAPRSAVGLFSTVGKINTKQPQDVTVQPASVLGHGVSPSRPFHQFKYQVSLESAWVRDEREFRQSDSTVDIEAEACEQIKSLWIEDRIWNPLWGDVPGMVWMHEEIDESGSDHTSVQSGSAADPQYASPHSTLLSPSHDQGRPCDQQQDFSKATRRTRTSQRSHPFPSDADEACQDVRTGGPRTVCAVNMMKHSTTPHKSRHPNSSLREPGRDSIAPPIQDAVSCTQPEFAAECSPTTTRPLRRSARIVALNGHTERAMKSEAGRSSLDHIHGPRRRRKAQINKRVNASQPQGFTKRHLKGRR